MTDIKGNVIANLMAQYHLSFSEASQFASELIKLRKPREEGGQGFDDRTIDLLIPKAIQAKKTQTYNRKVLDPKDPRKTISVVSPVTWGIALYFATRDTDINRLMGKKRNAPNDRRDTQFIEKKFTGGIRETMVGEKEPIGGKKYAPVYKHLKSSAGNEIVKFKDPEPEYYYYDDWGHMVFGSDEPPQNSNVAYLEVKLLHKVAASKFAKPGMMDISSSLPLLHDDRLPIRTGIGSHPMWVNDEVLSWKRETGIKEYGIYYWVGKDLIKSGLAQVPYEMNVDFNKEKMRRLKVHIKNELDKFRHEYGKISKRPQVQIRSKEEIRDEASHEALKSIYGDDIAEQSKNTMWKGFLLERRRKLKKAKASRKKVVKKSPIKKKCVCNPKQKRIVKKITPRKRCRK